jgi:hypothetical protein
MAVAAVVEFQHQVGLDRDRQVEMVEMEQILIHLGHLQLELV